MANIRKLKPIIFFYALNMGFVYYFEYCIQTGFFNSSNPIIENEKSNNFF